MNIYQGKQYLVKRNKLLDDTVYKCLWD